MIESLSFWEKEYHEDVQDIVVVGAGFVGLSAAIHFRLYNPYIKVTVLERGVINYGASTRNAGFSCFGTIGELEDDLSNNSEESVLQTVIMRWSGLQKLKQMVPSKDMDYLETGGKEVFKTKDEFELAAARVEFWNEKLNAIIGGKTFEIVELKENSGFYKKAIYNRFEATLNPKLAVESLMNYAKLIGIKFYFGISLINWTRESDYNIHLNLDAGFSMKTKKLIITTNGFTKGLVNDLDVIPARNQVLVTAPIANLEWNGCYHMDRGYIYFRNIGNRILLGGARNISENEYTSEYGNTEVIQSYLKRFLEQEIMTGRPVEIEQWWSGILGIGKSKNPIIKEIEKDVYVAVRLGGMGVAIGTKVGQEVSELAIQN